MKLVYFKLNLNRFLPSPSLSKRRRYYVARRDGVRLSRCVCVCPPH